ncbi:MAG: beta-ketoacyl-ACP synthase III [Alphaproteobacteria bacterium]
MKYNSKITATGSYLPSKILTNFDLSKIVETSDEWITERTGIKQRHIAIESQLTSDLAFNACQNLFNTTAVTPQDIDLIIVATTTPDLTFPSTACILQGKLKASKAFAFDIQAVCSGFIYALSIANSYICSGMVKNALVIGSETLTRIIDWSDRNTCVLFGDGAGAVLLQATENLHEGIISQSISSNGDLVSILKTNSGASLNQRAGFIEMQGKEVFKHAVEKMSNSVFTALAKANLKETDIDLLVPHQANLRILDAVASKLKLPANKVITTLQNHANTSAASIPLALDYAHQNHKIKANDIVVLEALGGGLTWGSIILRWQS